LARELEYLQSLAGISDTEWVYVRARHHAPGRSDEERHHLILPQALGWGEPEDEGDGGSLEAQWLLRCSELQGIRQVPREFRVSDIIVVFGDMMYRTERCDLWDRSPSSPDFNVEPERSLGLWQAFHRQPKSAKSLYLALKKVRGKQPWEVQNEEVDLSV
jgi:hypothetical protein